MLSQREYWRELLKLMRDARTNPLLQYSNPWKRGKAALAFLSIQLMIGLVVMIAAALWVVERWRDQFYKSAWFSIDHSFVSLLVQGVLLCSPFTVASGLLVFSSQWAAKSCVEELSLTRLTPREMAFGTVFWGALSGLLLPFLLFLTLFLSLACEVVFDLAMIYRPEPDGYIGRIILKNAVAILLAGSFIIFAACGCIKASLLLRKDFWHLLVMGPLVYAIHAAFLVGPIWYLGVSVAREWAFIFVMALILVYAALRSCGRWAGSLSLRGHQDDDLVQSNAFANEASRFLFPEIRDKLRQALKAHVPVPWKESLFALLAGGALALTLTGVSDLIESYCFYRSYSDLSAIFELPDGFELPGSFKEFIDFGELLYYAIVSPRTSTNLLYFSAAILFQLLRTHGRLILVNGAPLLSLVRLLAPLATVYILYDGVLVLSRHNDVDILIATFLSLGVLVVLLSLLLSTTRHWTPILLLCLAIPLFLALFENWYSFNLSIVCSLGAILLVFFSPWFLQRLFRKKLMHVPLAQPVTFGR